MHDCHITWCGTHPVECPARLLRGLFSPESLRHGAFSTFFTANRFDFPVAVVSGRDTRHWGSCFPVLKKKLPEKDVMNQVRLPKLGVLITGGLSVWAISCFLVHGPVIFAYVALQAVTSGVFAWQMNQMEKSAVKSTAPATQEKVRETGQRAFVSDNREVRQPSTVS